LHILSNSAKFSAGRPLLTAYSFLDAMVSTSGSYRLGALASQTFWRLKICLDSCVIVDRAVGSSWQTGNPTG